MKKFLLLLFTFISLNSFAQIQVKEGSFHKINGYVMMDKEDHIDVNDVPMALIKISTENITAEERRRITFKGNLATYFDVQFEPSEIYLYITAKSATFIEIHHPDYGKTEYWLPETLKDYCGYEMVVQRTQIEPEYGFLAISSEPDEADIYIDGELQKKKTNTVISNLLSGTHTLKLVKEGYNSLTKDFVIVKGEALELDEKLQKQSNEKYHLIVKADQPEAMIFIDNNVSTGEASLLVAKGTTHTWKIECDLYHPETGTVTVNERVTIDKKLRPAFGYLNISTTPEQGAKVYVDGKYLGDSPIKTDKLKSGTHTVRVMKELYKMKEQTFTVTDGQTTNATLNMAANFVNVTINTDSQSDIYVDEEYKGKGRWTGRLSDGSHIFEARKTNHKATQKTLDLVLGETKTVTLDAPKPINGSCEISSSPMGATIYIDGKNYGETPNYINEIIIGTHELKLEKQGCTTITKSITIEEGETLTVNEKLINQQPTVNSQQTSGNKYKTAKGTINGHEYVDLGLPSGLKWATCNVGANSPEEYGDYFAWGETEPAPNNNYSTYNSYAYGISNTGLHSRGYIDESGNLTSSYDAATVNWGGNWRMPTKSELEELIVNCTWTWTGQGGKNGYKVTGPNGNHIFLPAAGYRYGSSLFNAGYYGDYWSSTPDDDGSGYYACSLHFDHGNECVYWDSSRYYGLTVRPITE